jgi:predicted PurR-regulated permease PerM
MNSELSEKKMWTTKQVVTATLFVVCVLLSFWLLYRFRVVVFLFIIAMVIGTTIRPAVEWLYKRGISRPFGIVLIYLMIAAFLAGFLALVVPLIVDQTTRLAQNLPNLQSEFRRALIDSNNLLLQNIGWRIPARFLLPGNSASSAEEVFDRVSQTFYFTGLFLKGVVSVLAVFLLAYYWTQESNFLIRSILRLIPQTHRNNIREFIRIVELKIGGYVRGQGILSLMVGSAAFIAYALIGLPYALVLAIIAGIMELIPVIGPALGAIPAILVALSVGPEKVAWVLAATMVIQLLENTLLVPRIMKSSMGVNPILVLLSLITFSTVFGFPGALLAIPLAAVIQLIFEWSYNSANESSGGSRLNRITIQKLFERSRELAGTFTKSPYEQGSLIHELPEPTRLELTSISHELEKLLRKIDDEEKA